MLKYNLPDIKYRKFRNVRLLFETHRHVDISILLYAPPQKYKIIHVFIVVNWQYLFYFIEKHF